MSQITNFILELLKCGVIILVCLSCGEKRLFQSLDTGSTGIDFVNDIEESKDFNILEYLYMYNGEGWPLVM